jgi:hypothetical protein
MRRYPAVKYKDCGKDAYCLLLCVAQELAWKDAKIHEPEERILQELNQITHEYTYVLPFEIT